MAQSRRAWRARLAIGALCVAALLVSAVFTAGCKHLPLVDTRPLDQAGMWHSSIEDLRRLGITNEEVTELAKVRQAGVSDAGCVELLRIARGHQQPFTAGDEVARLRQAGVSEETILELARLNQFGLWTGEAQAIRLAGLSDQVLLAIARRRSAGQPVLSGASIGRLKNAGMGEAEILAEIERGTSDQQAEEMIAAHDRAQSRQGFVRQRPRRRHR